MAAEALPRAEGRDAAIYINKLVSELLFPDDKQLNIIAYTDNESLYHAVHTLKQTLEKRLLVDISSVREMVERIFTELYTVGYTTHTILLLKYIS